MALRAYEDACLRAELFGTEKPDRDEFLTNNKHLDVVEVNEDPNGINAEDVAITDEKLSYTRGGLSELNTILGSTQGKINRLKGFCGNITNALKFKLTGSKENVSKSGDSGDDYIDISLSPTAYRHEDEASSSAGDINSAIDDLKQMDMIAQTPVLGKESAKDVTAQVNNQIDKLDRLLSMADKAQDSMQHQNREMRSFLK